jgi:4-aminobutyrate aminotransferase
MNTKNYTLIPEQPDAPVLCTEVPGPKATEWARRDNLFTSPSYTRDYTLVVDHAIGSVITDSDGNRFLDMTAGIAVTASGHCHPKVVAAIEKQARRCLHMSGTDFYYETQIKLAEKLDEISPMKGRTRIYFSNSGAEAVEAALKLSRYHTGREHIIAFWGAFHGRTYGAMSLGGSKSVQRKGFSPMVPSITHVTFPNPYRPPGSVAPDKVVDFTFQEIEDHLFKRTVQPEEVAAIFVEPIQGEGGYIVPPDDFMPRLRALCDKHGILLVCDEIQSGMGRTGKMWAVQHWDTEPDIITSAKGLASGMPLGAMIAKEHVMNWEYGMHASTFGGNPVACAASLATIELLEEGLMENAETVGPYLQEQLREVQQNVPNIGDVRGKGLMVVAEFITDSDSKEPASKLRNEVVMACFKRGLLVLGCGESGIRFSPALTVSETQIDKALEVFKDACLAAVKSEE